MPSISLVPHLIVTNGPEALAFYKKALGAVEAYPANLTPDGKKVVHAELRIGDATLYLCDDFTDEQNRNPQALGGSPVTLNLTVEDADAVFERAVQAGGIVTMPMQDTFWGARYGKFNDPSGHEWSINQQVRQVGAEEIKQASDAYFG
jgi:uncharacterized glyoxalase superfamily protein PhnB